MAFISVLVVACTETVPNPEPTASPTLRPVTLTLQGSPGAPPVAPRPTLAALVSAPDESEPASPVEILPPVCSDTISDGYQCVGLARNLIGEPLGAILLRAELYDRGAVVETITLALEQRIVPPDGGVPYRFLFAHSADGPLRLSFSKEIPADERLKRLDIHDASGSVEGADYVVSAKLVNPREQPVQNARVVASLFDGADFVSYRVIDVESIEAGGTADVSIRWYAVMPGGDYHVTLSADAIAVLP